MNKLAVKVVDMGDVGYCIDVTIPTEGELLQDADEPRQISPNENKINLSKPGGGTGLHSRSFRRVQRGYREGSANLE